MTKTTRNATTAKLFGKELILSHRYYVAEQIRNGKQVRVSKNFAFQADAESLAREMRRKDHGRGGKFVVIVAN